MQTLILVLAFALSLVVSYPMMSLAQQQPSIGEKIPEKIDVPLNFTLKVKRGGEENKENNASSAQGGKDVTVTLKLRNSQNGGPMDLPLTAKVSNDTKLQDIELCGAMKEGKEMCQSLEKIVSEKGQNQSSGASSKESSNGSSNSTEQK
ncbi:MAG: hypothetical protein E6L03_09700 [Thaumarchaeota archaeon]|nr:MAG: hypothetical protein E6L03_09700 [Nitrososphaerota archaeon]